MDLWNGNNLQLIWKMDPDLRDQTAAECELCVINLTNQTTVATVKSHNLSHWMIHLNIKQINSKCSGVTSSNNENALISLWTLSTVSAPTLSFISNLAQYLHDYTRSQLAAVPGHHV